MKLQTTEITAQRLKIYESKLPRSPSLELSNRKQLDVLYQSFCQEARTQLDAQNKPILKHSITTVNLKPEDELKSITRDTFKQLSESKKKGSTHPLVKAFGNLLVASVFEALVLKAVEDISRGSYSAQNNYQKVVLDPDNGLSEKMMRTFGIDGFQLRGLKSYREKRSYLMSAMNGCIDRLLKNWRERIEAREAEQPEERTEKGDENAFTFLRMKTKYEALREKLTATVVQKLNDYENQLKIVETMRQRREKRQSLQSIHHDELKVSFTNLQKPQYQLFKNQNSFRQTSASLHNRSSFSSAQKPPKKQFNASFLAYNYSKHQAKPDRNMSTILTSEILEDSFKNNPKIPLFGTELTNKVFPGSPRMHRRNNSSHLHLNEYLQENPDNGFSIGEKHLKSELVWDPALEKDFQKAKTHAKTVFFDEVKKNNWDVVAIRNMVQSLFTEEKKNMKRVEKMKRYGEGDYLTAEELKFLADSSELLNACVDRRYLQNACNIIDQNNLHFIELNLAEKIIRKYEEMKGIVKNARLEYFRRKNREVGKKVDDFFEREEKKNLRAASAERGKRYKAMIGTIWQLQQEKALQKQEKEDDEIIEEMVLKNFSAKFKKNLSIADLLRRKEALKLKEKLKRDVVRPPHYQNLISESNNPLVVKHRFHPASKLHKIEPEDRKAKGVEFFHMIDNVEQEYRISIKCPGTIRVPRNFAKFYSGGPKTIKSKPLYNPHSGVLRPATIQELQAIIRIQSRLRGRLARNLYRRLLENHRNAKFVEAQERIFSKHCLHLQKQKENDSSPDSFSPSSFYANRVKEMNRRNKPTLANISLKSVGLSENDGTQNAQNSSAREDRIRNREPPKSLLLKHRKLLEAAQNDNYFMVSNSGFIYYPSDVNIKDKHGNTALFYTSASGNMEFTRFLLRNGAKVNIKCSEGNTPVHMAFKANNIDLIMALIESGGDLNTLNNTSQTPLAFAARNVLELLDLTEGVATVNERNVEEVMGYDNNKLLYKYVSGDTNMAGWKKDLPFKFDGIRRMTNTVREKGKLVDFRGRSVD